MLSICSAQWVVDSAMLVKALQSLDKNRILIVNLEIITIMSEIKNFCFRLFGFLTSSPATRLYRGRKSRSKLQRTLLKTHDGLADTIIQ